MSNRAVILAGGIGSRLRPYTVVLPKPLMPIGEYPILEVVLRQLIKNNFDHITIAVNHQADLIKAFFQNGSKWNIKIDYSMEDKPLSTMGPLKLIEDLPENFLVMNGDVLTDLDYAQLYTDHVHNNQLFTVSAFQREEKIDYGVLGIDSNNLLQNFQEKPVYSFTVSMGIYIINKKVLDIIPHNQPYGFDNLMHDMLQKKQPVNVTIYKGYWLDIGRADDYHQAIDTFAKLKDKFLP
jgi:NDP-sugar pyrophosphorylase family protein